jgi:hypothetical protein
LFLPVKVYNLRVSFFCEYRTKPKPHGKSPQKEQVTIRLSRAIYREKLYLARLSAQSVGYYPELYFLFATKPKPIKLMPAYTTGRGIVNHKLIVVVVVVVAVYCRGLFLGIYLHT